MTVRSFASASRNGIQRGNPPKPARKPSFGPLPDFQTRVEKPFSSTVKVSGSATPSLRRKRCGLERGGGGAFGARHRPRPPAVLPFGEDVLQLRQHLLGEELRVVVGEVLRHVAELQKRHQVADI